MEFVDRNVTLQILVMRHLSVEKALANWNVMQTYHATHLCNVLIMFANSSANRRSIADQANFATQINVLHLNAPLILIVILHSHKFAQITFAKTCLAVRTLFHTQDHLPQRPFMWPEVLMHGHQLPPLA